MSSVVLQSVAKTIGYKPEPQPQSTDDDTPDLGELSESDWNVPRG